MKTKNGGSFRLKKNDNGTKEDILLEIYDFEQVKLIIKDFLFF